MVETKDRGYFGERMFTGNALKYFAAALMVCDHLYWMLFPDVIWLTMLGRLVAPIFIFMVTEGLSYTRNRKKYALQLLVGSLVMHGLNLLSQNFIRFNPDGYASVLANGMFNIFSTMFMIVLVCILADMIAKGAKERKPGKIAGGVGLIVGLAAISLALEIPLAITEGAFGEVAAANANFPNWLLIALSFIPNLFLVEGGILVVLMGVAIYLLRRWRWAQMLPLVAMSALMFYIAISTRGIFAEVGWMMVFAVIPLMMYNGKRGKGGTFSKWFFYIFYPAHIYILFLVAWLIER